MSRLQDFLKTIVGSLVLAALFTAFVGRAFTVEGPSMMPTLYHGERLFVDKLTYRFGLPQRGDIVVFRNSSEPDYFFIKRIIGLPGDEVVIRAGKVLVNGVPLKEEYTNGHVLGRYGVDVVPADHYFVLGDNRNNSRDSRSPTMGYVPRSAILGRAVVRYWPPDRMALLGMPKAVQASP